MHGIFQKSSNNFENNIKFLCEVFLEVILSVFILDIFLLFQEKRSEEKRLKKQKKREERLKRKEEELKKQKVCVIAN